MIQLQTIDIQLAHYITLLNTSQKKSILQVAKTFVEKKDWWDELSLEQQQQIDKAIEEADNSILTPHADVMKKYKKWLK